jgi:hypothetical protein
LIDDDVTKSEPNEQPATAPQPNTSAKKPAEPVLDERGRPPAGERPQVYSGDA